MKASLFILPVLLLGELQLPPPQTGSASSTPVVTGAFFAISVPEIAASTRWYSENLGLRVTMEVPRTSLQPAVTVLEGRGLIVELIQNDNAVPVATAAPAIRDPNLFHGLLKAGFIVEDFDATVALFRKNKVDITFGPYPSRSNQRANVIVKDNAGNLIQVLGK